MSPTRWDAGPDWRSVVLLVVETVPVVIPATLLVPVNFPVHIN
jgi:hypothetical protein